MLVPYEIVSNGCTATTLASVWIAINKSLKLTNAPSTASAVSPSAKEEQISSLENSIQALKADIVELKKRTLRPAVPGLADNSSANQPTMSYASAAAGESSALSNHAVPTMSQPGSNSPRSSESPKKYNLILYGVDECPTGTSRSARLESDLSSSVSTVSAIFIPKLLVTATT